MAEEDIKELLPRLNGEVTSRAERELYLAFRRIYDSLSNQIANLESRLSGQVQVQVTGQTKLTQLVNQFATELVKRQSGLNLDTLGTGTVSGFSVTDTAIFDVTSPAPGTINLALKSQTQNKALMSPNGSSGVPTFRGIARADIKFPFALTTTSAADPSTSDYPDGTWGLHKNTVSGFIYLAYNNGGTIVKVQLV